MKVAFVSQPFDTVLPPFQNSIGIWTYQVASRLTRSCEVIVYTKSRFRWRSASIDGVEYRFIPIDLERWSLESLRKLPGPPNARRPLFASRLYYLGYALRVASDLRREQCDLVHIYNFSQFVPVIRAFNPQVKIVLHMQCEWLTQLDRAMIEKRLREVDLVIGCSRYITEKIRRSFPEYVGRCQTIFNGVDPDLFHRANRHGAIEKDSANRLLFVGRVSPEKGVHVLLDAFHQVIQRFPHAEIEIVGPQRAAPMEFIIALSDDPKVAALASFYSKSYMSSLKEQASGDLRSRTRFTGFVVHTELVTHYHDADVFIFPSVWSEPFGMPIVEAMASGVPVIATRAGGIPEILEDGKSGLLVEPGDAAGLAEAVQNLLSRGDMRRSIGGAGRQRARELFTWDRVAGDLLRQYRTLDGIDR